MQDDRVSVSVHRAMRSARSNNSSRMSGFSNVSAMGNRQNSPRRMNVKINRPPSNTSRFGNLRSSQHSTSYKQISQRPQAPEDMDDDFELSEIEDDLPVQQINSKEIRILSPKVRAAQRAQRKRKPTMKTISINRSNV